jgi:hypothetical protein
MTLYQNYIVDAAELPTSTFTTGPLSELKCEVMLHHAEASLQWLIILVSLHNFFKSFAVFVTVVCCFWWKNSHSRRPSQSQNTIIVVFFAYDSIFNFFVVGE